jgi:hypothetical protein
METNNTPNFTNYTFHDHEWWIEFGGSLPWSDAIGVFVMPPILAVGIIVNLIGFLILQFSSEFKHAKIYIYLKFTFLNGFICNATGMLYPFTVVRRYLPFADTYFALWYMNAIGLPIANVCYYYNLILDILITFEKLSIFVKRFENLNKKYLTRPQIICMVVFIVVLLIDLPYFFFYTATVELVYLSTNETYEFANYEISEFTQSKIGSVILFIQYAIRDIIPLLCLIALNVALIHELKKYIRKKRRLTNVQTIELADRGTTTMPVNLQLTQITALDTRNSVLKKKDTNSDAMIKKAQKSHVSTTFMVILICVFSFVKSSIILTSIVYSSLEQGIVANLLGTFSDYLIYTITTLNFFIVLMFDRNFHDFFTKHRVFRMLFLKCKVDAE